MAAKDKHILDVSIIVKWFTDEEDSDKSLAYLRAFQNNEITITVPSLTFYELGNVLISKKLSVDKIGDVMAILQNLGLQTEDIGLRWLRKIYQNSIEYSLTFYDAAYITLMQEERCEFVTADSKLFEKVHKDLRGVKLL